MAITRFTTGDRKDIFLYRTHVENLFINEFLPDAPGDCVKVFLFGLMYAQFNEEIDSRTMALTLGMSEQDVDNAWKYWESKGLVRIIGSRDTENYGIEFVRQIDLFYGKTIEESFPQPEPEQEGEDGAEAIIARLINQQLREIFDKYQMLTGRTLSRHEANKLADAIKVYNIEPDVLDFAISYCVDIDKASVDYICKVALRWKEEGCKDVAQVKAMLDRHSRRNEFYRKVFSALSFNRLPTPAEREIMDRWLDGMGCSINDVLEACNATAGIREPNLRYVNKVLENKMLEKGGIDTRAQSSSASGSSSADDRTEKHLKAEDRNAEARVSRKVLRDYYDYIRQEEERNNNARIDEVMDKVPAMRDIFASETILNNEVLSLGPGPGARERRMAMRERRRALEEEKRSILTRSGYPEDYLTRKYRCSICKDTGYTDEGRVCTCCKERAEEAYRWIQQTGK